MRRMLVVLALVGAVWMTTAATIPVDITVTIPDDAQIQARLRAVLDNVVDPANAGGNYVARYRAASKAVVLRYWQDQLRNYESYVAGRAAAESVRTNNFNVMQ